MDIFAYQPEHFEDCMAIFDANTPQYFAPNERLDFQEYLAHQRGDYWVLKEDREILASFGNFFDPKSQNSCLNWIMVKPNLQKTGIGHQMMERTFSFSRQHRAQLLEIAASQFSAPFFEIFGAQRIGYIHEGFGPDMHRIDMTIKVG